MNVSECKGCGKPIVWATDDKGQKIPLDPRAPVYNVLSDSPATCKRSLPDTAMVSHFATCPKANDFSRTRVRTATFDAAKAKRLVRMAGTPSQPHVETSEDGSTWERMPPCP